MTGYTVHTGASKKFVAGWDNIFAGKKNKEEPTAEDSGKKTKKSAKKSGKKK